MQITLEIEESIFDKFLWMLEHFKEDIKIIDDEVSDEENEEIKKILNSRSLEDKEVSHSKTITIEKKMIDQALSEMGSNNLLTHKEVWGG